jgi:hypothetical protein
VPTTYVSVANSIALYLESISDLDLTFGTNLYADWLPDTPDQAVAVFERPGLPTRLTMTGGTTSGSQAQSLLDSPLLQIRVRAAQADYAVGNTLMQQVWGNLNGLSEIELPPGGLLFHLLNATGFPMFLGRDIQERPEWSLNLSTIMENTQRIPA